MKSPFELLYIVLPRDKTSAVEKIFEDYQINSEIVVLGEGTADTNIGSLFSFGIDDKALITAFVRNDIIKELLNSLQEKVGLGKQTKSIAFTTPINAMSSDLFNTINVKEEKNEKE